MKGVISTPAFNWIIRLQKNQQIFIVQDTTLDIVKSVKR